MSGHNQESEANEMRKQSDAAKLRQERSVNAHLRDRAAIAEASAREWHRKLVLAQQALSVIASKGVCDGCAAGVAQATLNQIGPNAEVAG